MTTLTNKKKLFQTTFSSIQSLLAIQGLVPVLQVILASCIIGICAQIKISLFFTPIPLTIQTPAVLLMGILLGSRKGALAVLCYLAQGWIGLPVWAGGNAGILYFMGPTGGYLMAYIVQAYLIGWFFEKQANVSLIKIMSTLLLCCCLQLAIGTLWLAQFVGIENCFMLGFFPFVIPEVVKSMFIALYVKSRKQAFCNEK